MMVIDAKYNLQQKIYLSTDTDQKERLITGICIRTTGIMYDLVCGASSSWHYEFELTEEKNVLKSTLN